MSSDIPSCGDGKRGRWIFDKQQGRLVQVKEAPKIKAEAPFVQTDEVPEIESMVDGSKFTSKARYRRHLKDHGYIERGNEAPQKPKYVRSTRQEIRETAEKAYMDVKYGRVKLSDEEKERCLREEREWEAYKKRQRTQWA